MELGLLTLGDHRADPSTGIRTPASQRHKEIFEYLDFADPAGFDLVAVGERCLDNNKNMSSEGPRQSMPQLPCMLGQKNFKCHIS